MSSFGVKYGQTDVHRDTTLQYVFLIHLAQKKTHNIAYYSDNAPFLTLLFHRMCISSRVAAVRHNICIIAVQREMFHVCRSLRAVTTEHTICVTLVQGKLVHESPLQTILFVQEL
jgi:hypothetical protein